jgi:hypothetical protein
VGAHRERTGRIEDRAVRIGRELQAKPPKAEIEGETEGETQAERRTGSNRATLGSICGTPKKTAPRKIEGARDNSLRNNLFRNSRGGTRTRDPGIMSAVL